LDVKKFLVNVEVKNAVLSAKINAMDLDVFLANLAAINVFVEK
jgi:hypothetical protein